MTPEEVMVPMAADAPVVLIVDDEPNLRRILSAVLGRDGYQVLVADGGRDALKKAKQQGHVDLLVTDFLMPDMNGLELLDALRKRHPNLRALVISGHATVRTAVEAMRRGASDFLTKPFDVEQVRLAARRALAEGQGGAAVAPAPAALPRPRLAGAARAEKSDVEEAGLIGNAPATRLMTNRLLAAAPARSTVLLLGESGTGKEVAARLLHRASPRRAKPFVAVSCAALPETLLESELFGHEKNAFTGALTAKPGRFELADGGTLFLDEIGDIPALTQVKLLRALQEREVCRIGGIKTIKTDVRVVAATNRDLWQAVQDGSFRADLYYRLHVIPVVLPPLRERREDIAPLTAYFVGRLARENGRAFPGGIAPDALRWLEAQDWPGNIRELQNVLEYAVVLSAPEAERIEAEALPMPKSAAAAELPLPRLYVLPRQAVSGASGSGYREKAE